MISADAPLVSKVELHAQPCALMSMRSISAGNPSISPAGYDTIPFMDAIPRCLYSAVGPVLSH
jgi:hypothetical protein